MIIINYLDTIKSIKINSKSIIINFLYDGIIKYDFNIIEVYHLIEKFMNRVYKFSSKCYCLERWLLEKLFEKYNFKLTYLQISEKFIKLYSYLSKKNNKKYIIKHNVNNEIKYFCKFKKKYNTLYYVYTSDKKLAKIIDYFTYASLRNNRLTYEYYIEEIK